MKVKTKFYIILAFIAVLVLIAIPREDKILSALGIQDTKLKVRQGLDLQGGASLLYQADLNGISSEEKSKAITGVIDVINKRVNPTGTSEVLVQTSGGDRVLVQLPGITNIDEAINLIGKTAELNFYQVNSDDSIIPSDISGKDLDNASTNIDPQSGQPVISFTMKNEAINKFAELTTQINKTQGRLLIVLDDQPLFNGTVSTPITDGKGQMTGFENIKSAQETAVLLNAGALPVPVTLAEQRTVGASLGSESISKSLLAGIIGMLAVIVFMIVYYKLAGVIASIALVVYALINIDIFKISVATPFPIVLTLAGIAGFILSIGMAVDANILIFERWKEEVREGSTLEAGLESGFKRAWSSIRDSNISTLITCIILYNFGQPIIKGFAVTLAIGVLVSMFTAITVSRTFLQMLIQTSFGSNEKHYRFRDLHTKKDKSS
ncbi:MAG: Protein translocase subunit SecD [Patescibacteria group bacterium]|nr:Protein translocase subunit SecD [Patescibacteria group bacterium]